MTRSAWTWTAFGFANRSSGPCFGFGCICWLPRLVMTWLGFCHFSSVQLSSAQFSSARFGLVWSSFFNCLGTWRRPELRIFAAYCICRNYARKSNTRQHKQPNATWWLIVESCTPSGLFVISRRWNYKLFWVQPQRERASNWDCTQHRVDRFNFFWLLFRCERVHKGFKHEKCWKVSQLVDRYGIKTFQPACVVFVTVN